MRDHFCASLFLYCTPLALSLFSGEDWSTLLLEGFQRFCSIFRRQKGLVRRTLEVETYR